MSLAAADIPVGGVGAANCALSLEVASSSSTSELSAPLLPPGPLMSFPLLPVGEIEREMFDAEDAAAAASATTFTAAAAAAASALAVASMADESMSIFARGSAPSHPRGWILRVQDSLKVRGGCNERDDWERRVASIHNVDMRWIGGIDR